MPAPASCIRIRNSTERKLELWIEPLGDHVVIPQHMTIEVNCTEQLGHPNEIDISDSSITIHGWVRSVSAVSEDGGLQRLWTLAEES